ncbi:hypothetical protein BK673_23260 [Pseudomonas fluorescens]|uniref:Uncharacterized protein n=1 Tax=Pseudomonas fluorescens TaxID=294 RepID=A0A423P089_PSEFL|nr:hypothetical protein BOW65_03910 [Pseudomonas koreensis]ROO04094.1 hypothetical protein BK673_23260 [Pseudomonas fluorescens]
MINIRTRKKNIPFMATLCGNQFHFIKVVKKLLYTLTLYQILFALLRILCQVRLSERLCFQA